jgi:outer membrane protein assembly factor BamB
MVRTASAASVAMAVPPGAPAEDIRYANEWPAPNGDLYNTRVAHSTISSTNVSKLEIAWTIPLRGTGLTGADVANPVIAAGIAYLQDGASNVMAVRYATGQVLWTHVYNSPEYGPNGVTIANGRIYGVTATGVFALDATTGRQVWYDTHLAARTARFDIAPQVANGKVFVASALTVGGGILYALRCPHGRHDLALPDRGGQGGPAAPGDRGWRLGCRPDRPGPLRLRGHRQSLPLAPAGAGDPQPRIVYR